MKFSAAIIKLLLLATCAGGGRSFAAEMKDEPQSACDLFNAGTRALRAKKFPDAEKWLKSALMTQDEKLQPAALYNLGHVRFEDGMEALKKGPSASDAMRRGKAVSAVADQVLQQGRTAVGENNLERMIASYQNGRGLRKELREAQEALHKAMEVYGNTLRKWQRAADDFHGAAELNPADTNAQRNAQRNAEIVEQHIAKLVDSLQEMQQMDGMLGGQRQQLQDLLSDLKGRIPKENAPPGGEGEDEEEPDQGSMQGQKEGASRDGNQREMPLSPEAAGQLLDSLAPNGNRRLPMTDQKTSQPKDKKGRTW